MKIALVFCGQPRNINAQLHRHFSEHLLSRYDVDVYAHFWLDAASGFTGQSNAPWVQSSWLTVDARTTVDAFERLYAPKRVVYDPPLVYDAERAAKYTRVRFAGAHHNLVSYYTSMKRSYELIDRPEQYDYIIHSRTDIQLLEMPDFSTLANSRSTVGGGPRRRYLSPVTTNNVHVAAVYPHDAVDNTIWIAPSKVAGTLFSMVDSLDALYDAGVLMNDEEMAYGHLRRSNLDVCANPSLRYVLKRS